MYADRIPLTRPVPTTRQRLDDAREDAEALHELTQAWAALNRAYVQSPAGSIAELIDQLAAQRDKARAQFQDALWTAGQHATTAASLRQQLDTATGRIRELRRQLDDMTATAAGFADERDQARAERDERLTLAESSRLAKRCDEAEEARDVARRQLDAMKAAKKRILGRLEMAEHVIDLMRDGREQQDRALAAWDTQPAASPSPSLGSPSDRAQDEQATLPAWVLELVRGLDRYELEHPKLFRYMRPGVYEPWDCPAPLLELVPAEVRRLAEKAQG